MGCAILKFTTAPLSELTFLCLHILDQPGLDFNAIDLIILQMVGHIEGCTLYKFQIDILQIEVRYRDSQQALLSEMISWK